MSRKRTSRSPTISRRSRRTSGSAGGDDAPDHPSCCQTSTTVEPSRRYRRNCHSCLRNCNGNMVFRIPSGCGQTEQQRCQQCACRANNCSTCSQRQCQCHAREQPNAGNPEAPGCPRKPRKRFRRKLIMKCMIRYAVFLALITLAPNRSSAQASDIIGGIAGALLNAAVNAPRNTATPAPAQPARQSAQPTRQPARPRQTTSTSASTTKKPRSSVKSASADPDVDSPRRFDGTWLATRSKVSPEGELISQIFTIVVKNGKATKTLDATNKSTPDKPLYESAYELRRKWTYSSTA